MQKITVEKVKFSTIPLLTDATVRVLVNIFLLFFYIWQFVHTHIRVMLTHSGLYSFLPPSHLIFIGADCFPQMSFPPEWFLSWAFDFLFSSLFQDSFGLFQALAPSLKEFCPCGLASGHVTAQWLCFHLQPSWGRWQEMAALGTGKRNTPESGTPLSHRFQSCFTKAQQLEPKPQAKIYGQGSKGMQTGTGLTEKNPRLIMIQW